MAHEPHDNGAEGQASSGVTRRSLLHTGAAAGATGIAASLFTAGAANATTAETAADIHRSAMREPLVAHVHDARTGEVDLFVGTRHTRVVDHQLVHRMTAAAEASTQPERSA